MVIRLRLLAAAAALSTSSIAFSNPAHDQIQALGDAKRATFFAAYLTRAGERCASVSRTFFQGMDTRGAAFWNVQCAGGEAWQLMINNDAGGSARYLSCSMLKTMNAGTCFRAFK